MASEQKLQPLSNIQLEIRGRLAWLRINRPHKANALNTEMLESFLETASDVSRDPGIHGVVVHAAGSGAFCGGADVSEPHTMTDGELWDRVSDTLWDMPVMSVALVNGACIGGGLTIALGCDIRVAVPESWFEYPVLRNRIHPCDNDLLGLHALVGQSRTDQLVLSGLSIDAYTALQWGLVDRVVQRERLVETAEEICAGVASVDRDQVLKQKANLRRFRNSVRY